MKLPIDRYPAYTLLEMLVVMSIFIILSALSMVAFNGFRDTITLNEEIDTLRQSIREAQRASLFLERDSDERWLYGIGVDFTTIGSNGRYRMFKWCAPFNDFGDIRSRQRVPNYNPQSGIGGSNGNLGVWRSDLSKCVLDGGSSELVRYTMQSDSGFGKNFQVVLRENNAVGDVGTVPEYILFEAVSGKAFFYDRSGNIVNYSSTAQMISAPINLQFEVRSPNTGRLKTVTIFNISGRVKVEDSRL